MTEPKIVSVDIETVVDVDKFEIFLKYNEPTKTMQKDLDKLESDDEREKMLFDWFKEKCSFQPHYIKIVGLNWMKEGSQPFSFWVGEEIQVKDERQVIDEKFLLEKFWSDLALHPTIVGANFVNFDLKTIQARSALLGIRATRSFYDVKPWEETIIDLTARMNPYGKLIGMKVLREMYLPLLDIPHKYEDGILSMDGDDIDKLYHAFLYGDKKESRDALVVLKAYGELDALTGIELHRIGRGIWWP